MSASRSSSAAPAAGAGASAFDSSSTTFDWAEECMCEGDFVAAAERCREVDASRPAMPAMSALTPVDWSDSPVFRADWPETIPIFTPKTVLDICRALPVLCRELEEYDVVINGIQCRAKQYEFFFDTRENFETWREAKLWRSQDEDHYKHAFEACSYALVELAKKMPKWSVVMQRIHTEFSDDNIVEIREVIRVAEFGRLKPITNMPVAVKSDTLSDKLFAEAKACVTCTLQFVNRTFPISWTEVVPLSAGLPVARKGIELPRTYAVRLNMRKVNDNSLNPKLTAHLALQYIRAIPAWTVSDGVGAEICRITFVYTDSDLVAYEAAKKAANDAKNSETARLECILRTAKLCAEGEKAKLDANHNDVAQIERYARAEAAVLAANRKFNEVRTAKIVIDMQEIIRQRLTRDAAASPAK